jgi:hypothetical protein
MKKKIINKKLNLFISLLSMASVMFLLLFSVVGCKQTTETASQEKPLFAIDLQDGFQHDLVEVALDNNVIYNDTATTSIALSFARRLNPVVSAGIHKIHVFMPGFSIQADTTIDVNDTLVVGVNFNKVSSKLSFTIYHFWVMYR